MTDYLRRKSDAAYNGPGQRPESAAIVDEHVKHIIPGTVISSAIPRARTALSYAMSTYGRWLEFYGEDKSLLPISSVERVRWFPSTLIIHGDADDVVDIEDSKVFVKKLKEVLGDEGKEVANNVVLVPVMGVGHGFDTTCGLMEEDAVWLRVWLKWVEDKWLA